MLNIKKPLLMGAVTLSLLGSGVVPVIANADSGVQFKNTTKAVTTNAEIVLPSVTAQIKNDNINLNPNTDAYNLLQAQRANQQSQQALSVANSTALGNLAQAGISTDLINKAIAGDKGAESAVKTQIAQSKVFTTTAQKEQALNDYNQVAYGYRVDHKQGVWVEVSQSTVAYSKADTKSEQIKTILSGNKSYQVKGIEIVKGFDNKGKGVTWYKLANGAFVKASAVVVDKALTNTNDYNALYKARVVSENVANKSKKAKKTVKKHAVKKHTAKKVTYYTHFKKGKHVAIVKKALVQHATKTFKDKSAKVKKNNLRKGSKVTFNKVVKVGKTYKLHLTNGKYVTANKAYVHVIK